MDFLAGTEDKEKKHVHVCFFDKYIYTLIKNTFI